MFARLVLPSLLLVLLLPGLAFAQPGGPKVEFDIEGYYRARGHLFVNLFDREFPKDGARDVSVYYFDGPQDQLPETFVNDWYLRFPNSTEREMVQAFCRSTPGQCRRALTHPDRSGWLVQRGRFEPIVRIGGIKAQATIDVLDNVLWGDNENLANTPLFAGSPSTTQVNGDVADSIQVKRLWIEWKTAFGLLRIGRQPSNWGLGLLANDGNGFKNDFGDAYDGATYDRIIFATQPIALVKGIAGLSGKEPAKSEFDSSVIVAVGFDKLVESSSVTFRQRLTDDPALSDENAQGAAGIRQSPIWLSDRGDDVLEMIYVLMFKREDWKVGDDLMDLTVGTYWVNRWQAETQSNVWIPDVYIRWALKGLFFEGELYHIFGKTQAIAPDFDKTTTADITGFAWRFGYDRPAFTGLFEMGYASGDDAILDERFTGRPLHRDYNVGLILYEQVLAQRTVEKFVGDPDTQGLWSNGGVYNSTYINPRLKIRPNDFLEFRLGFLMAWANQVDGAIVPFLGREDGSREAAGDITESTLLGTEVDLGIHMKWLDEHILIALEGGYMRAGPRLGRLSQYQDPSTSTVALPYNAAQYGQISKRLNNIFTVQTRFAFVF
ncbi:MAG: hypothetical protein VX498_13190 [Myxococcota bacterium]|nr:hypothetical protein [Myxococcota bacterium]